MFRIKSSGIACLTAALILTQRRLDAAPVGSAFSYQGRLATADVSAEGSFDFSFRLYDSADGGGQVGQTQTNNAVVVSNGVFTVPLDFGAGSFDGEARWLEIAVRAGTNLFTTLSPRQPVLAMPYAITAASVTGPVNDAQIPPTIARLNSAQTFSGALQLTNPANVFIGNGAGLTNLDTSGVTNWVLTQGYQPTNGVTRKQLATPSPVNGTNYVADFLTESVQVTATNNINFLQSTNRTPSGWYGECVWYIQGGTTNRTLRCNTNWTGVGTLAASSPILLLSNKLTIVAMSVRGGSETNVTYAIVRQE